MTLSLDMRARKCKPKVGVAQGNRIWNLHIKQMSIF